MNKFLVHVSSRYTLVLGILLSAVPYVPASRLNPQPTAVLREVGHDVSPPLWQMAAARSRRQERRAFALAALGTGLRGPLLEPPDAQGGELGPAFVGTVPLLNFEGIAADNGQIRPDTNGAVGATQFVQWVNVEFAVYDKMTGRLVQGPLPGNTLWSGFPGPCATSNSGQPIAQYDKAAGRWVMAQPVLTSSNSTFTYCIAVSTSSDATGTYNRYAFDFPQHDYPDYGKLAVWPDAYYASFNIYQDGPAGTFLGPMAVAYDRVNMLNGSTARAPVAFQLSPPNFSLLPSDFDGTVPPQPGEPDFYMELSSETTL